MVKKMIFLVFLLFGLLISMLAQETGTLKGTVTDEQGDPVPYANIFIKGTIIGTQSNENGEYEIKDILPGSYTIMCRELYHYSVEIPVYIYPAQLIQLKIVLNIREIPESYQLKNIIEKEDIVFKARNKNLDDNPTYIRRGRSIDNKYELYKEPTASLEDNESKRDNKFEARDKNNKKANDNSISNRVFTYRENKILPFYKRKFYYPLQYNTNDYKAKNYYPFIYAFAEPISTFSHDVDSETYGNIRKLIKNNKSLEFTDVRIEDMINYFSYSYPEPQNDDPVSISYELGVCPWNNDHDILKIGLKGKSIMIKDDPALNIVFILDTYYSSSDIQELAKQSVIQMTNKLNSKDHFGIVKLDAYKSVVLNNYNPLFYQPLYDMNPIDSGSREDGFKLAYKIADENYDKNKINRIILLKNVDYGNNYKLDPETEKLIEQQKMRGITLSILGVGNGFNNMINIEQLANKGNGKFYFIDDLVEANRVFNRELGNSFKTIAKDVKIQIDFNPAKVRAYRLIGYENIPMSVEDYQIYKNDLGEIDSDQVITVLYEIVRNNSNEKDPNAEELKYQEIKYSKEALKSNDIATMKFRYKDPDGTVSKEMSQIVKDAYPESNSKDFNFACSVAGFGMMLQKSKFKETLTWDKIKKLAKQSIDKDPEGYRREFISLIEKAELLDKQYGTLSE